MRAPLTGLIVTTALVAFGWGDAPAIAQADVGDIAGGNGAPALWRVAGPETVSRAQIPASATSGVWEGEYACRNGRQRARLRLTLDQRGRQLGGVFDFTYVQGSRARGSFRMEGDVDQGTGSFALRPTTWIERSPGSVPAEIEGSFDARADAIRGTVLVRGCGDFVLRRAGSGPGAPVLGETERSVPGPAREGGGPGAAADTSLIRPRGPVPEEMRPVVGHWRGTLTCSRSASQVFMTIEPGSDGRMSGSMEIFPASHLGSGSMRAGLIGEPEDGGRLFRFATLRADRAGIGTVGIAGFTLTPNGSDLQVGLPDTRCQSLVLRRDDGYDLRRVPTVAGPPGGGSFATAQANGRPCDAITEWALRVTREFPNPAGRRSIRPQYIEVLLFGDEDFVPVFGRAFDGLGQEIRTALSQHWRKCKSDPLVRQRLDGIDNVDRALSSADLTSFGRASVAHVVQEQREVRRRIADATRQIGAAHPAEAARLTAEAKKLLEDGKSNFWPSDLSALMERVENALVVVASDAAAREVERIAEIPDRIDRLREANAVISGSADFMKGVDAGRHTALVERMRQAAEQDTRIAVEPVLARIHRSPANLAGLSSLDAVVAENKRVIDALDPSARKRVDEAVNARKTEVVGASVRSDLEALRALPDGKEGLTDGVEWRRSFDDRYGPFAAMEAVKEADRAFRADRNRRLREALPSFEAELGELASKGDADQLRALLAAYLGWPGDRRLTASIHYLLTATSQTGQQ